MVWQTKHQKIVGNVDEIGIAKEHAAVEIVKVNQKIMLMLQQWLSISQLKPDVPSSSLPDGVLELMKRVDALLLVIGHTPKYTHVIAEHDIENNVINYHYLGK